MALEAAEEAGEGEAFPAVELCVASLVGDEEWARCSEVALPPPTLPPIGGLK